MGIRGIIIHFVLLLAHNDDKVGIEVDPFTVLVGQEHKLWERIIYVSPFVR